MVDLHGCLVKAFCLSLDLQMPNFVYRKLVLLYVQHADRNRSEGKAPLFRRSFVLLNLLCGVVRIVR